MRLGLAGQQALQALHDRHAALVPQCAYLQCVDAVTVLDYVEKRQERRKLTENQAELRALASLLNGIARNSTF